MNRNTVISFLVGLAAGVLGFKFIGSQMSGVRMLGAPRRRGLGMWDFPGLTDWDTETRATGLLRALEGVYPVGHLGDVPNSFYGGESAIPSFEGAPDFLYPYDPDGPKHSEFGGYPWDGGPRYMPSRGPL